MLGIENILFFIFGFGSIFVIVLFLILFFDNRKKIKFLPKIDKFPSVSILIPAHNEEKAISRTIKAVRGLAYPKNLFETIVIDDGSTDKTYAIAKKFKGVKVIKKKNGGKASALNFGLRFAKGNIVGCVDADSCPKQDALLKSVPYFKDKATAAVTSYVHVRKPKNILEKLQWIEYMMIIWSRKMLEFINSVYVTPGPLSLYRKKVLIDVGGFDEKNVTEDIEIAWRLLNNGYKIKMACDAKSFTRVPSDIRKWWRQRLRWNIGGIQTTLKYKNTLFKKEFGVLGNFVLPFFSIAYILSIMGIGLLFWVLGNWIFNQSYLLITSYKIGLSPTSLLSLYYVPSAQTILGIIILVLSIVWIKIAMNATEERAKNLGLLDFAIYLTLYITLFPLTLIHAMWRYVQGKYNW